jgi:dolichyl-phosphate beta-glucosyltransferase
LRELRAFADAAPYEVEIIVVVEKSTDDTAQLALDMAASDSRFRPICNPTAHGKGYAVKVGMLAATGDYVFFMDTDLSVPLRTVDEFLPWLKKAEVVFGSRRHAESVIVLSQPWQRVAVGRIFNLGLRILGATSFSDTQCGFKAFHRSAAQAVFSRLKVDGFGFDVEALALAEVLGFQLIERPVEWTDGAGSTVRAWRDGSKAFFEAVLAAWRAQRENSP